MPHGRAAFSRAQAPLLPNVPHPKLHAFIHALTTGFPFQGEVISRSDARVDQRMGIKSEPLIRLLKMALWPKKDVAGVLKVRHFRKVA